MKGRPEDTGTAVLVNQPENAMKANRRSVASFRSKVDDITFAVCLSSVALALAAFAGAAAAGEPKAANPVAATASHQPAAGTFTGAYVNGMPVYRLPSVSVSASRAADTAAVERERGRAQSSAAADSAGKRPDRTMLGVRRSA